ncbi:hypothetical protein CHS0354_030771 [Potamilus streckersoni]|uniref:Uncharacterized protein n=1 Tax=Potamilus streckersoni TaxID=2493646 RepID=A0AAE0TDP5_9BIVA|nr:hypothetical protein CHS0354_030771 [Potamilus streckersoni]
MARVRYDSGITSCLIDHQEKWFCRERRFQLQGGSIQISVQTNSNFLFRYLPPWTEITYSYEENTPSAECGAEPNSPKHYQST